MTTTTTTSAARRATLATPFLAAGDDGPERVLEIPPLPGRTEEVVVKAAKALSDKYAAEVEKAEQTIADFGLTIEVTRLRDRLARSAGTDLQRLLLATAGVPELLFNEAIAAQLDEEEAAGAAVKDESVQSISTRIVETSASLQASLSAINESTQKFQESTGAIVASLEKVASALQDPDGGDGDVTTAPRRTRAAAKKAEAKPAEPKAGGPTS